MNLPKKKWTICLLHLSHTDVGYTDRQEKIESYHIDFIRQATQICKAACSEGKEDWKGFKWVCESFWGVEKFLESATDDEIKDFCDAVRAGNIGLSANYLGMTDLVDYDVFSHVVGRGKSFAEKNGLELKSAVTSDVNGYNWGYGQALADNGVENLFISVHTHHGMFPLHKKQTPFFWELPDKKRLLVWSGEHYAIGNDLGLAPDAYFSYSIKDEFDINNLAVSQLDFAAARVTRYLSQLENEDYPYDFVPVPVLGIVSDNAPPNPRIAEFLHQWNSLYGQTIAIEMSTPTSFFEKLRSNQNQIPCYCGDWPDWWADGIGADAKHVKIFTQAQRDLQAARMLDPENRFNDPETIRQAEYNMMLFGEHTWSHSDSVRDPFNSLVQQLEVRKSTFASEASRIAASVLDKVLLGYGQAGLYCGRPLRYKIINPFSCRIKDVAYLFVDFWEVPLLSQGFVVVNEVTGGVVTHQLDQGIRGTRICVIVDLLPEEMVTMRIVPTLKQSGQTTSRYQLGGLDEVTDICRQPNSAKFGTGNMVVSENSLETQSLKVAWGANGIDSWIDKTTNTQLVREDSTHSAFFPVYEISHIPPEETACSARRKMGRNRKGYRVLRTGGKLIGRKLICKGELFTTVELLFEVEGCVHFSVTLTAYQHLKKSDVTIKVEKQINWEPENLYISLPFASGGKSSQELWVKRSGVLMRPLTDQLPGSNADYYCVQDGVAITGANYGVSIAMPDTPLIQVGSLQHEDRKLSGYPGLDQQKLKLYSWVLNNFWETNWKASVEGFYEFRYHVGWGQDLAAKEDAIQRCVTMNQETICVRIS